MILLKDVEIANYLKAYDVKDRPYGHGYLAAAYIGYLASGKRGVKNKTRSHTRAQEPSS